MHFHVLIATPAYGCVINTNYLHHLLSYQSAGLPFTFHTIGNESLITRARNSMISWFHEKKEFTHLLFIDADVGLPAEGLANLITHEVDVVSAAVPVKHRGPHGERRFNFGRVLGEAGSLWKVDQVGTAVLMLSRRAVDALVDDAIKNDRVYSKYRNEPDLTSWQPTQFDIFQVGVLNGDYLSEDFWVCTRLRELGFDIHLDPEVITQHYGTIQI